ncbi:MAG: histidine phosphatase family protein [Candidatus Brocadiales bacterium]|nr:histidine phosphatase family protein [Candidatus Brocadiales bacterium]
MNLILVRHGEIPSNVNKVYAGRSPENLTEKGIWQAQDVARKLLGFNVDTIFTSPIQRAVQTAEIIRSKINAELITITAFRELEMGPWEGLSENDIAIQYPEELLIWNQRPAELKMPGRETLHELQERVLTGVQSVFVEKTKSNIVVISHVAIIRVLMLWNQRRSLNLYKTIHVPNAEIIELKIDTYPKI